MPFRDLSSKKLDQLSHDEVIYLHLTNADTNMTSDFYVKSSLRQIEESMRSAFAFERSKYYGPALCAFAIFDQIGGCYQLANIQPPNARQSFKKGLHYFGGIDGDSSEAQHLYAFRNAQVHDASYTGMDTNGNWYIFRHKEPLANVIIPPQTPWDGTAMMLGKDVTTYLSLHRLIEMATNAIDRVYDVFENNRSNLIVNNARSDLIHKYLMWVIR